MTDFARVEAQLADHTVSISHLIPVDGRVSWLPPTASGWDPWNHYIIDRGDAVVLVDSGLAAYGPSLVSRLVPLVGDRRLVVYITRIEPDVTGNLGLLIDAFEQFEIVSSNPVSPVDLVHWHYRQHRPRPVLHRKRYGSRLDDLGLPGFSIHEPAVRTLGTSWLFDEISGLLFTTDAFTGEQLASLDTPLARTGGEAPTASEARANTLAKFDWIATANLDALRAAWDRTFATLKPGGLAPIHGRPIIGSDAVAQTVDRYAEAIFSNHHPAGRA